MSWIEKIWGRIDVRLALVVGGLAALVNALLLSAFTIYAVSESMEREAQWLRQTASRLAAELASGQPAEAEHVPRPLSFRVVEQSSGTSAPQSWSVLEARQTWSAASLESALWAEAGDFLVDRIDAGPHSLEVALPLDDFVVERGELVDAALTMGWIGLLASLLAGIVAARRALRPVREIDAAMRSIRASSQLGVRVAERGTGDDVDRLAASINELLGRISWSFDRLAGFSGDVAHELRTPLHRLLNESELLLLDHPDTDRARSLSTIHETIEQMRDLVNQMLLLASGEEGRLHLRADRVELRALCSRLVEFYVPVAEGHEQTLSVDGPPCFVACDQTLLERALANLIENALAHTSDRSTIVIRIDVTSSTARVGVLDSGPGIPATDRERIFDRFVRLDHARHGRGGGLGLPIARMIARLHGGSLRVSDSQLGGAAFWMEVPLADGVPEKDLPFTRR